MDLMQTLRLILSSFGSGASTLLPGQAGFRLCTMTSIIAALCWVVQKLGGEMGITCEDREGMSTRFVESLCGNLASLMIPFGCWNNPDRVQMLKDNFDPSMFGSHRCHHRSEDEQNQWVEYWQHDWTTVYFIFIFICLSSPKALWKVLERGMMAAIVGSTNPTLVMRNGEESQNVTKHLTDHLKQPGLSTSYVLKYMAALTYGLLLQLGLFWLTVAFLPGQQFLTYGTDMAAWSVDYSAAAALHFRGFNSSQVEEAEGPLPSFLLMFPPAALCPLTYSGYSGTAQFREIRCSIHNSRFAAPAYLVLWWAFALNIAEKGYTLLKLLLTLTYYPTGWALRRISMAWMLRGTELENRNLKALIFKLTFSQFVMLGLVYDVMDQQAFADLLRTAQTQLEV